MSKGIPTDPAEALHRPVFLHVFTFLGDKYLFRASLVSRAWREAIASDNGVVWRMAIERRWGVVPENSLGVHWKRVFMRKLRLDAAWAAGEFETKFLPVSAFGVRLVGRTRAVCWNTSGQVIVYDLARQAEERRIAAHAERIWWLAACDSGLCVTASADRTLKAIDLNAEPGREVLRTLSGHANAVWCCDVSERGDIVASGSDNEELVLWRLSTAEPLHTVRRQGVSGWYDVKVADPDRGVVVAAARQCVVVVDSGSGQVVAVLDRSHGRLPNFLTATPEMRWGLVYASDTMHRLRIWNLETRRMAGELELPGIAECVIVKDDKLLTGIDENGSDFYVMVWSLARPNAPEHLYDVAVDLPAGSRRLYSVEVRDDAIVCCTQAEQLIVISVIEGDGSKKPKRKPSRPALHQSDKGRKSSDLQRTSQQQQPNPKRTSCVIS